MSMNYNINYCKCDNLTCPLHPTNHIQGCNLCIKKNLKKKEIPTCFFKIINEDISGVEEFTLKEFVNFYLKHNQN